MARISKSAKRRLERFKRRHDKIVRHPAYVGRLLLYRFDASLRIVGIGQHHDTITQRTGLVPTSVHHKGQPRSAQRLWQEDVWSLASPIGGDAPLEQHLEWLWNAIAPHSEYFRELISEASRADVVLGCFSESPYPFLTVETASLRLLREMDVGISFNFTCV